MSNLPACQLQNKRQEGSIGKDGKDSLVVKERSLEEEIDILPFNRQSSFEQLKNKVEQQLPLVVHVFVPLCDNKHQGIVPVSKSLGNGFDLKNNLYWGAKYGIKNHFKTRKDWQLLKSEKNINEFVLERAVFKKVLNSQTPLYLVADAYSGDAMQACVDDYIQSFAGLKKGKLAGENDSSIDLYAGADLLVFNGHNGLMDVQSAYIKNRDGRQREAAAIACVSHDFFKSHLNYAKAYPLLFTTNLMAPEAYNLEALINAWAGLKTEKEIRQEVGKAYHRYQKCGLKGAINLFTYGW